MMAHKHTLPNHAMPCHTSHAFSWPSQYISPKIQKVYRLIAGTFSPKIENIYRLRITNSLLIHFFPKLRNFTS